MARIGVLVSGGGTNLQAIIDACGKKILDAEVGLVISNNKKAKALNRAKKHNIPGYYIESSEEILKLLKDHDIDLVVLAGYLQLVPSEVIKEYEGRILNIHPSLIPSFSGKGYYGIKVHEAAIKRGVKISGATVHLVNENYDEGKILIQEAVRVYDNDSPRDLQERVLEVEHRILVEAIYLLLVSLYKD